MTLRGLLCALAVFVGASAAMADPYPLATDPVTGEALGKSPVVVKHEGRELRFANQANAEKFAADPKAYLAKVDAQIVEQQRAIYPLETCVVGGGKLGSMGKPVEFVHDNRLVRLCCAGCKGKVTKETEAIFKKIDAAAIEKQKASYPLKTCVVSGEELGNEPVDKVVAGRLVRLCCEGCAEKVTADPAGTLAKIDAAKK